MWWMNKSKSVVPTLRKPRSVGQPHSWWRKGGPAPKARPNDVGCSSGPFRLSSGQAFSNSARRGAPPVIHLNDSRNPRYTSCINRAHTRQIGSSVSKVTKVQSIFISSVIRGQRKCDCSPNSRCFFNYFFVAGWPTWALPTFGMSLHLLWLREVSDKRLRQSNWEKTMTLRSC